ncbi:transcription initiation factor IIF, beta subunit-domain-containing protein [Cubamyces lactineus]|nr:transcription initiation factor IIF, beta subunit-domain-containing protein [Cubamyces lactineus]
MSFSALEVYEPELHGQYEDWSMDTESDGDEGPNYDSDAMRVLPDDGTVYLVKIPKHLIERWTAIDEEGVHLATIRFYHDPRAASASSSSSSPAAAASASTSTRGSAQPSNARIVLTLPPDSDDPTLGPDEYEMELHTADPEEPFNQYVVADYDSRSSGSEADPARSATQSSASSSARSAAGSRGGPRALTGHKHKGSGKGSGKETSAIARTRRVRRIALAGIITHHGSLRAVHGERLRQRVKARSVAANTRTRQTILIEHHHASRSAIGGGGGGGSKKPFIKLPTKKATKGPADRNVRIPRPKLLDMLFGLFEEKLRWPLKVLRERTQQPEAYLKKVLSEIAYPHRAGEHRGAWELSASYRYRKNGTDVVENSAALQAAEPFDEGEDEDVDGDGDGGSDLEDII